MFKINNIKIDGLCWVLSHMEAATLQPQSLSVNVMFLQIAADRFICRKGFVANGQSLQAFSSISQPQPNQLQLLTFLALVIGSRSLGRFSLT